MWLADFPEHTVDSPCCNDAQPRLFLVRYRYESGQSVLPICGLPGEKDRGCQYCFRIGPGERAYGFMKAFQSHSSVVVCQIVCVSILGLPCEMRCRQSEQRAHGEVVRQSHRDEPELHVSQSHT